MFLPSFLAKKAAFPGDTVKPLSGTHEVAFGLGLAPRPLREATPSSEAPGLSPVNVLSQFPGNQLPPAALSPGLFPCSLLPLHLNKTGF